MAYCIEPNERYLERLWQEPGRGELPHWNPSHFLDTAEMTRAFAIAYDWLYDVWSQQQRQTLREAIIDKGLDSALMYYHGKAPAGWQGGHNWTESNWCFVVNGGIATGALALADEVPEMAGEILQTGLYWVRQAITRFSPDGGWDEGTGYWHYSIRYLISYICALETALGTDFGLTKTPGIDQTGFFPVYLTNNKDETFNFRDTGIEAPRLRSCCGWPTDSINLHLPAGCCTSAVAARRRISCGIDRALMRSLHLIVSPRINILAEWRLLRSAARRTPGRFSWPSRRRSQSGTRSAGCRQFRVGRLGRTLEAEQTGADNYNLPGYQPR